MNTHSFRVWIKNLDHDFFIKYNVNPVHFKLICYTLSMYGDYETGTNVKPSWLTVSKEAGVDRKTAMKVRDILLEIGILTKTSNTIKNISVYKFNELSKSADQLSKLDIQLSTQNGHNTTIDTTNNRTYKKKYNTKNTEVSWSHTNLTSFGSYGSLSSLDKESI